MFDERLNGFIEHVWKGVTRISQRPRGTHAKQAAQEMIGKQTSRNRVWSAGGAFGKQVPSLMK